MNKEQWALGGLRLALGWLFFWAWLDKVFGLGFATPNGKAWLDGVSPTAGFLSKAVHGPFASLFNSLSGSATVDWLFMLGLLLIGLALLLGIGMTVAAWSGALMLLLMWLALLPPANNPFLDDHLIYILALCVLHCFKAGRYAGLGEWWSKTALVQKYRWLE